MNPKKIVFVVLLSMIFVLGLGTASLARLSVSANTTLSPANDSWTNTPVLTFGCDILTNETAVNTTLWVTFNDTTWKSVGLNVSSVDPTINYTLAYFGSFPVQNGTFSWFCNSSNSALNVNTTPINYTFHVDTVMPTINFISLAGGNAMNTTDSTPELLFNMTDNLVASPYRINWSVFVDGVRDSGSVNSSLNNTMTSYNLSTVSSGTHTVVIEAYDPATNRLNSTSFTVIVDLSPPNVSTVHSPAANANLSSGILMLNATVIDAATAVSVVRFNITNGTTPLYFVAGNLASNYWNASVELSTLAESSHTVQVLANDTMSQLNNTKLVTFLVDRTAPTVTLETTNDSIVTTSTPSLQFNVSDALASTTSCVLYVNNTASGSNGSVQNNTRPSFTVDHALVDGLYYWSVNCTDGSGNLGAQTRRQFTVVTTQPTVTVNSPANGSGHQTSMTANVTVASAGTITGVQYRLENSSGQNITGWIAMMNTSAAPLIFNATINVTNLTEANYTLRINATNQQGFNSTNTTRFFFVDRTAPSISAFTLSDTTPTVGDDVTSTCSATDALDRAVSTAVTGVSTTSTGSKIATCTATDHAGNTATSTVEYTVAAASSTSSGGGSSGGSSSDTATVTNKATVSLAEVSAAVPAVFKVPSSAENPIDTVTLDTTVDQKNVDIIVAVVNSVHSDVKGKLKTTVYKFISINHPDVPDKNIEGAEVKFAIENSWLQNNNLGKDQVALFRYKDSEWKEFKAQFISTAGSRTVFSAAVPGLSTFAIGKSTTVKLTETTSDTATSDSAASTPEPETDATAPAQDIITPPTPEVQSSSGSAVWWVVLVLVVLMGAVVGGYFYWKSTQEDEVVVKVGSVSYTHLTLPTIYFV